jgi:hypothetical protein
VKSLKLKIKSGNIKDLDCDYVNEQIKDYINPIITVTIVESVSDKNKETIVKNKKPKKIKVNLPNQ